MLIPTAPEPTTVDRISPALYEDLLTCYAKGAWDIGGDRGRVPPQPARLLGVAFHAVLEAVHQGEISGDPHERREAARQAFDRSAARLYESAHPLVRVKFRSPERLPYYNQQRELAAMLAMETDGPHAGAADASRRGAAAGGAEHWYVSEDGLIFGRPDFVDVARREVVDYKTGHVGDGAALSDREKRQLALYAFLVQEAGIDVEKGRIVRADGEQTDTPITVEAAQAEAVEARSALNAYNVAAATSGFKAIASPSTDGCRFCECKPFCEAFWESAIPDWGETCGVHCEGLVMGSPARGDLQGVEVLSLRLRSSRGTVPAGREVIVPQVPVAWFTADGDRVPQEGDLVRLVDGRRSSLPENEMDEAEDAGESETPLVVNGDRISSTFWRVDGALTEGQI
jgi:hypothetical protein